MDPLPGSLYAFRIFARPRLAMSSQEASVLGRLGHSPIYRMQHVVLWYPLALGGLRGENPYLRCLFFVSVATRRHGDPFLGVSNLLELGYPQDSCHISTRNPHFKGILLAYLNVAAVLMWLWQGLKWQAQLWARLAGTLERTRVHESFSNNTSLILKNNAKEIL